MVSSDKWGGEGETVTAIPIAMLQINIDAKLEGNGGKHARLESNFLQKFFRIFRICFEPGGCHKGHKGV